jgi:hypothetical protein
MNAHGRTTSVLRPSLAPVLCILALAVPALAVEEGLHELRLPPRLVEQDVQPETAAELPPPTYPVERVEQ